MFCCYRKSGQIKVKAYSLVIQIRLCKLATLYTWHTDKWNGLIKTITENRLAKRNYKAVSIPTHYQTIQRDTDRERGRDRNRDRERETETQRKGEREGERQRGGEGERERQRQTDRDRDKERARQRED